jgi:hypothetical protein
MSSSHNPSNTPSTSYRLVLCTTYVTEGVLTPIAASNTPSTGYRLVPWAEVAEGVLTPIVPITLQVLVLD